MAIVSAEEYWKNLYRIQDENPPSLALLLPSSERTYYIDLNTRTVQSPKFLGVSYEHKSEVLYFVVNRYYDYMDLTNTVCIVKIINADNESIYYAVPFYDVVTPNENRDLVILDDEGNNIGGSDTELMMFPWVIGGDVVKSAGTVKFQFNFYKIDFNEEDIKPVYGLSTLVAESKVLKGMNEDNFEPEDYEFTVDRYEEILGKIDNINKQWQAGMVWLTAE